ncbi:MAG: M13 family metallopeptidase [Thermomicrobiales bacterium]
MRLGRDRHHVRHRAGHARAPWWALPLVILLAFGQVGTIAAQTPAASPVASPVAGANHGIQLADMDLSVAPGYDFYRFANGGWADRATIPAGRGRYTTFDELSQRVDAQIQAIVDGTTPDTATDLGKVRMVYDMTLDWETRNAQGLAPIQPALDRLAAIDTTYELMAYLATDGVQDDVNGLFGLGAGPSADDATLTVAELFSTGLGLPNPSYHLDDSPENIAIREAWIAASASMLMASGYSETDARAAAEQALAFDTALAGIMTSQIAFNENPALGNNPRTLADLEAAVPSFPWSIWFATLGVPAGTDIFIVSDLLYLGDIEGIIGSTPASTMRDRQVISLLWGASDSLSADLKASSDGFDRALRGISEPTPDEEAALDNAKDLFPDALSKAYVDVAFSPEAKAQIEELVGYIIAAFRQRILDAPWMSEETKLKAIEKLDLITVKVGYPDTWTTYENVSIEDSLYATLHTASLQSYRGRLATIGQPVDRTAWDTPAYEVNAFYSPTHNEIVFPAAILQAPFFDPQADAASNYGGIGAVIGHEITHGFDLTGSQFDGYGNLSSWWTQEDRAAFEALNARLAAQYSTIEILPGLHVNGEQTIGENVADFGGTQTAFDALQLHLAAGPGPQDQVWFLTQQQRFFVANASNFRVIAKDAFLRNQVATDPHAPGIVRSTMPLRNMDAFYEAFFIQPGDPMYIAPEDRIVIW